MRIWTIGHSNRSLEEFIALLVERNIQLLVDVRRYPGSRKNPQFHVEPLMHALNRAGIEYRALPLLGGRRNVVANSHNTAWHNPAFQGYADHMETVEFRTAIGVLAMWGNGCRTAFMCSEAVWWRCHRSMIADYLATEGHVVLHILSHDPTKDQVHPYTSAAQIVNDQLSYRGVEF